MRTLIVALLLVMLAPQVNAVISTGYRHTNDYYAVVFDGEGDAVVSARLTIRNTRTEPFSSLTLEFPQSIVLYDVTQETSGRTCGRYVDQTRCGEWEGQRCLNWVTEKTCSYWQDYGTNFERLGPSDMHEQVLSDVTALTLDLPIEVQPEQTTTLILSYKINSYATKFVNHKFDFETIIDNNAAMVENVRVSVNVQPGLHLKGGKAEVEYKSNLLAGMQRSVAESAMMQDSYREYSTVIQSAGGIVKTATYLDPGESFHVKGKYSSSFWALHAGKLFWFLLLLAVISYGVRYLMRSHRAARPKKPVKTPECVGHNVLRGSIAGFLSAFGLIVFTTVGVALLNIIDSMYLHSLEVLLTPVVVLLIVAMDLLLLFAPAVYIGRKYELVYGLLTFAATIIFLLVLVMLLAAFFAMLRPPIIRYF